MYEPSMTPTEDYVIIEPLTAPGQSPGGILIPESAREKPQKGVVLAVGPGLLKDDGSRIDTGLQAGDLVLYGKWSGCDIEEDDGKTLRIVRAGEIMAKARPEPKRKAHAS